ncbi:MAG TPA: ABC transporter permease [Acidobacteriota bacterium]|nr:ABC transporter permease [Acidobacteriota bacterium]
MLTHHIRFALRGLLGRHRLLAGVCLLTLALGIGLTTSIFSVLKAVVLEPLPYPQPDRLVQVFQRITFDEGTFETPFNTGPHFIEMEERLESFQALAALYTYSPEGFNLTLDGTAAERVSRLKVSAGYFQALGVQPFLGRGFRREENLMEGEIDAQRPSSYAPARRLAVLSHGLWQRIFNGAESAVGDDIVLDGEPYTVLGVMPAAFKDPLMGEVDVWLPQNLSPGGYNNPGNSYLAIMGRLKPEVALEAAQQEMDALDRAFAEDSDSRVNRTHALRPLQTVVVGELDQVLWILTAAVGILLLVACANVANLLLAWGASRRRELALRSALGCNRRRLVGQLLAESLCLASLGGAAGLLVAVATVPALLSLRPENLPTLTQVTFDYWIFLFSAALTLGTGLIFGLVPALNASRVNIESALREGARDGASLGEGKSQRVLVGAQVALAVILLAAAGLLGKSFLGLLDVELGFQPSGSLVYRVDLPMSSYGEPEKRVAFHNQLHQRLTAASGITATGAISHPPVSGLFHGWGFREEGAPNEQESYRSVQVRVADGNYFEALKINLLRGRLLRAADRADSQPVVVVNRKLAETYYADQEVLGKRLLVAGGPPRTVVGVVEDVLHGHLERALPKVYLPHNQFAANRNWKLYQVAAYAGSMSQAAEQIRRTVASLDPGLAVYGLRDMEDVAAAGISQQRFAVVLMGVFSACTLLLATIGLYGILSQYVLRRRREIGIRMALGASRWHVQRQVVGQGLWIAAIGLLAGTVAALGLTRWLSSMLEGVEGYDPTVYLAVTAFLALVALAVGAVPARRAATLDPMRVLREE